MVTQVDAELPGTGEEFVEPADGVDEVVVGSDSRAVPDVPEHAGTAKSAVTAAAVSPPRKILIRSAFLQSRAVCFVWTMASRR